jgi:hypothetical protein
LKAPPVSGSSNTEQKKFGFIFIEKHEFVDANEIFMLLCRVVRVLEDGKKYRKNADQPCMVVPAGKYFKALYEQLLPVES